MISLKIGSLERLSALLRNLEEEQKLSSEMTSHK